MSVKDRTFYSRPPSGAEFTQAGMETRMLAQLTMEAPPRGQNRVVDFRLLW